MYPDRAPRRGRAYVPPRKGSALSDQLPEDPAPHIEVDRGPARGNGKKRPDTDPKLAARRQKVSALMAAGYKSPQIGTLLGISDRRARTLMQKERERATGLMAQEARHAMALDLDRLDRMLRSLWHTAMPLTKDSPPNLQAMDRVLNVMRRRAKMLGLDAPAKHEIDLSVISSAIAPLIDLILRVIPDEAAAQVIELIDREMLTLQGGPRFDPVQTRLIDMAPADESIDDDDEEEEDVDEEAIE